MLFYAKDEADRLNSKSIGTEHLLLGLLQEQACPAAKLLTELGANVANLRETFEQRVHRSEDARVDDLPIAARGRSVPRETVVIHGFRWYLDYIYDRIKRCREHRWRWSKEPWKPQDCVRHKASGLMSLNLSLAQDSANFELIKRGWKKDFCAICRWELFESSDDHGSDIPMAETGCAWNAMTSSGSGRILFRVRTRRSPSRTGGLNSSAGLLPADSRGRLSAHKFFTPVTRSSSAD